MMIKFLTVWVLTVIYLDAYSSSGTSTTSYTYQLQYATQEVCEKQRKNHTGLNIKTRCNFQQVPIYVGNPK